MSKEVIKVPISFLDKMSLSQPNMHLLDGMIEIDEDYWTYNIDSPLGRAYGASLPSRPCDCGAIKAQSSHAFWCSANEKDLLE